MEQSGIVYQCIIRPYNWIKYYFFQPTKFNEEFDLRKSFSAQFALSSLSLIVLLFLGAYLLALVLHFLLFLLIGELPGSILNMTFLFVTFLGTLLGTISGTAFGIIGGKNGVIPLAMIGAITADIPLGISLGFIQVVASNPILFFLLPLLVGIMAFCIEGRVAGRRKGKRIDPKAGGKLALIAVIFTFSALFVATQIIQYHLGITITSKQENDWSGLFENIIAGLILGYAMNDFAGIILFVLLLVIKILTLKPVLPSFSVISAIAFIVCYSISYWRLPTYLFFSVRSTKKAYSKSRKYPRQVFTYLKHSALYWDERARLPLPGLQPALRIAVEQDLVAQAEAKYETDEEDFARTMEIVKFIVDERPQQRHAAWAATLEIIMKDLEIRDTLDKIAQASQHLLSLYLSYEPSLTYPDLDATFRLLNTASRDADRCMHEKSRNGGLVALDNMLDNLKKIPLDDILTSTGNLEYKQRLERVVHVWQDVAEQEQQNIRSASTKFGFIDDPYKTHHPLALKDKRFVGRTELLGELREAFSKEDNPASFILRGERRMGKTSILNQLSDSEGSRYLFVKYDLQESMLLSSAALLSTVAEGIWTRMVSEGWKVRRLPYEQLQGMQDKKDEKAVYFHFDRWLKSVETILERERRTLVLAFDEFAQLKNAGNQINLVQLLQWFRAIIDNNHPRIALLFCGLRAIDELDKEWKKDLVKVQVRKVTFLNWETEIDEARRLIIRPIPNFPGDEIFDEQVVSEILRLTARHPFLIQALCSALISHLNKRKADRATLEDVNNAVQDVHKAWEIYFQNLLDDTKDQRDILLEIINRGRADLDELAQFHGVHNEAVARDLKILMDRDLVVKRGDQYESAIPLLSEWIRGQR